MDNFSLDEQQQRLLRHLLTQSVGSDVSSPLYSGTPAPPGMSDTTYNYGGDSMGGSYYSHYHGYSDSGVSYGGSGSYNMTNYSLDESLYQKHKTNSIPDSTMPPPGLNPYTSVNGYNYNHYYNNFSGLDQFNGMLQDSNYNGSATNDQQAGVHGFATYDLQAGVNGSAIYDQQASIIGAQSAPDTVPIITTQQSASIPTEVASQYKNNKKSETLFNFLKKKDDKDDATGNATPTIWSPAEQHVQPSSIVQDKSKSDLLKKLLLGGASAPSTSGAATLTILSKNSDSSKKKPQSSNNAVPVNVPKKPVNYADVVVAGVTPSQEQSKEHSKGQNKPSKPSQSASKTSLPAKTSQPAAKAGNATTDSKVSQPAIAKGAGNKNDNRSAAPEVNAAVGKNVHVARKSDEKKKENYSNNLKSTRQTPQSSTSSGMKKVPSSNFATSVTLTAPDPVNIPLPTDW